MGLNQKWATNRSPSTVLGMLSGFFVCVTFLNKLQKVHVTITNPVCSKIHTHTHTRGGFSEVKDKDICPPEPQRHTTFWQHLRANVARKDIEGVILFSLFLPFSTGVNTQNSCECVFFSQQVGTKTEVEKEEEEEDQDHRNLGFGCRCRSREALLSVVWWEEKKHFLSILLNNVKSE